MDNPRPEKVAVVDEVRGLFGESNAAILTEYRGLKVKDLAGLRRSLRPSGGEYRIYKNTLVRLAAKGSGLDALEEMLVGPVGIAFVTGDAAAVAKALRDFSRANPLLVIKGGLLGEKVIGATETSALADLPPGRSCWRSSPGPWPLRCSSWPGSCRPCPGTWPTGWRPSATREPRTRASIPPASPHRPTSKPQTEAPADQARPTRPRLNRDLPPTPHLRLRLRRTAAAAEAPADQAPAEAPSTEPRRPRLRLRLPTPSADAPSAEAPSAEAPSAPAPEAAPADSSGGDQPAPPSSPAPEAESSTESSSRPPNPRSNPSWQRKKRSSTASPT